MAALLLAYVYCRLPLELIGIHRPSLRERWAELCRVKQSSAWACARGQSLGTSRPALHRCSEFLGAKMLPQ